MQDAPLLVSGMLRHGQHVYGDSQVITVTGPAGESTESTFTAVAERSERLAKALGRIGVGDSDRVGTFLWNNQTHLEAYLAIPGMGAVLHTLNIRLFPEQLAYVINHGEDKVIIVDASVAPLLAKVRDQCLPGAHPPDLPRALPPGRAPGPHVRRAAAHVVARGAHHLERPAALRPDP